MAARRPAISRPRRRNKGARGVARDPGVVGPGPAHIKKVCDRFAAEGFSAAGRPTCTTGKTADEPDTAGKLFMALNVGQAEKDLRGADKFLAGHSSTAKLGAVGFCMGGQLALFAATLNPNVGATVNFYGNPSERQAGLLETLRPGARASSPRRTNSSRRRWRRRRTRRSRRRAKPSEIHIYPGVDHGFFNDERPDVYNKGGRRRRLAAHASRSSGSISSSLGPLVSPRAGVTQAVIPAGLTAHALHDAAAGNCVG